MVAAQVAQASGLTMCLHPLGRDLELQALSQADNRRDDGFIIGVLLQIPHEASVDLDMIDRKLLEMGQRCISGPEVIQRDLDSMMPELGECRRHIVRVSAKKNGFGDFHLER